jgi:predicted nucleotidyltransferase
MNQKTNHKELNTSSKILHTNQQNGTFLKRMGVKKIGLFGSYQRGSAQVDSDMDFLVRMDHPTFDNYMDIKIYLEDLFNCKIDIVLEDSLKPRLIPFILEEVVYAPGL